MPITVKEYNDHIDVHNQISKIVINYFQSKNYSVFSEVKLGNVKADIVGIRDQNLAISVEVKTKNFSEIRKGVGQCLSYLDWVHNVYLAIPIEMLTETQELLRYTPIGLITIAKDEAVITKEAEFREPDGKKLYQVLQKTTGYCWICGKTFNIIEPTWDRYKAPEPFIPIAFKDDDPELIKNLEELTGLKKKTKNYWVGMCKVCSRLLGNAFDDYLRCILSDTDSTSYDFGINTKEWPRHKMREKLRLFLKEKIK